LPSGFNLTFGNGASDDITRRTRRERRVILDARRDRDVDEWGPRLLEQRSSQCSFGRQTDDVEVGVEAQSVGFVTPGFKLAIASRRGAT